MRTKTLLLSAAVVAAGVASSMAQSNVYSLNIVGYVNIPVTKNKIVMLNNPFDTGVSNNAIANVLLQPYFGGTNGVPDPALDYGWDGTFLYHFQPGTGYIQEGYNTGFGWAAGNNDPGDANGFSTITLPPGKGFWLIPTTNGTVTFTGSVVLSSTNTLVKGIQQVGSVYAGATTLAGLGLGTANATTPGVATEHANDGDFIYRWYTPSFPAQAGYTEPAYTYSSGLGFNTGYGWYDNDAPGGAGGSTNGPIMNPGEGFWYLIGPAGQTVTWPQNFTVN